MIHHGVIVPPRDNADVADSGVYHVGKDKIDCAVASADRQRADASLIDKLAEI